MGRNFFRGATQLASKPDAAFSSLTRKNACLRRRLGDCQSRRRQGILYLRRGRLSRNGAIYPLVVWLKEVTLLFFSRKAKISSCLTLAFILTSME